MIKAAGLNPDDYQKNLKWSDVVKLGVTVKAKTGKPLIAYQSDKLRHAPHRRPVDGHPVLQPDGSLNLRTPAVKQPLAIQFKDTERQGPLCTCPKAGATGSTAINNDDTAGFLNAIWMVGTIKSKPENKGKWMVIPTPLLEGVPGAANASNNGGSSWYVFASSPNKALAIDFLKSTWASSDPAALEFYNAILKGAGAMGTYLPSQKGSNYTAPDEFFYKSQAVYKDFADLDGEGPRPHVHAQLHDHARRRRPRHPPALPGQDQDRRRRDRGRRAEYKQTGQ
jgi:lactose/L-arabinose transport system substrate-binding protein